MNCSLLLLLLNIRLFSFLELNGAVSALNSRSNGQRKHSLDPRPRLSHPRKTSSIRDLVASPSINGGSVELEDGKQGISSATFNLVKACLGAGVLALPAAVATMGDVSRALLPASMLLGFLGILSAYSFYSIGRTCSEERVHSLEEAWERIMGKDSAWIVTLSCFIIPLSAALIYSIVLGDFLSSLARAAGVKGLLAIRQTSILAVTAAALYPLCLLKSLAALAPMSIIGVLSVLLTALFMSVRALDGTYATGGKYFSTLNDNLRPSFGTKELNIYTPSTLVLTSMVSSAFLCHFCAPDFYHNLRSNTLSRFKTLTALGFSATALINTLIMCMGFLTFGGGSSGMVLNNYSSKDIGATFCRLLMCINLIGSYPFVFGAMKSSFISMTPLKGKEISDKTNSALTRLLLSVITFLALTLDNVGFVISFNGALMGSAIIYIFPSVLFLQTHKYRTAKGVNDGTTTLEINFNRLLIIFGVIFATIGGAVSIADAFFPQLLK